MKRTRPSQEPRWQHSDARGYDSLDFGFTRFVDAADVAGDEARQNRRRGIARALRRLLHFRHDPVTDTRQISR
jgi:hypothetical protein